MENYVGSDKLPPESRCDVLPMDSLAQMNDENARACEFPTLCLETADEFGRTVRYQ
jgi:hypothetical protein